METHPKDEKTVLSFSFSKKQEIRQLGKSVASEKEEELREETDYLLSFEKQKATSTNPKSQSKAEKELVIPLIKQNKWRKNEKVAKIIEHGKSVDTDQCKSSNEAESTLSIEEQAAKEILEASSKTNSDWDLRGEEGNNTRAIPLLMQNQVPLGFETDEKLNVELRPEEPDDADYEQIPIEHFGMAMLRGMGWKEGRGIGKTGKVIAPIDAQLRPKGLGLGADKSNNDSNSKKNGPKGNERLEENLELKKGAFCFVTEGVNKDLYGIVEGLDEDNARAVVKLTLNSKVVNVMQCNIKLVSKKDYDKFSTYLNKQTVDKFKEREDNQANGHDERNSSNARKRTKKDFSDDNSDDNYRGNKHKRNKRDKRYSDDTIRKSNKDKHIEESKSKRKEAKYSSVVYSDEAVQHPWLRNELRVRVVDKNLKNGKYYKEKVVIIDVPAAGVCVCRTEDGKVLEDVSQSSLETVIPRSDSAFVAIVSGRHRSEIGQIMKKDKDKCLALVQLLSDRDSVLKLDFDEICEYVGDVHSREDF